MKIYTYDTIVIGSGAAGYSALCRLCELGVNAALITERRNYGTSRNTGSDKQTYYKLSLEGEKPDSVREMAEDLYSGGCVDGDNALVEAALSARAFMYLTEAGVEFPINRYGEYVGYKTDHDRRARATSAGPLTSRYMTEALERRAEKLGAEILSGLLVCEILTHECCVTGVLAVNTETEEWVAIKTGNVILATGGPAGIFADSVYPESQTGSTSLALLAGAHLQSFTEWQTGLASVSPRWNVSGTYMQVLPRIYSVDVNGAEYEFLKDEFSDEYEALSTLFLKGYEWPFDAKKLPEGSSKIDLLVRRERIEKKRQVFLDYRKNPFGLEKIDFSRLSDAAREYLEKSGADFGTPIERLLKMNTPAYELYLEKGVDLTREPLEIALCVQHNNGGVAVDMWWQSCVRGLFAVGECAGTHGVTRPGGSALNAGQVGALRASQYIASHPRVPCDSAFRDNLKKAVAQLEAERAGVTGDAASALETLRRSMSDAASSIRSVKRIIALFEKLRFECKKGDAVPFFKYRDALLTSKALLFAILDYAEKFGVSRGSAVYTDVLGKPDGHLEKIQEIYFDGKDFKAVWRDTRSIPESDGIFEKVWSEYRKDKNVR